MLKFLDSVQLTVEKWDSSESDWGNVGGGASIKKTVNFKNYSKAELVNNLK